MSTNKPGSKTTGRPKGIKDTSGPPKVMALIAGGGRLPQDLAHHLIQQGQPLIIVALEGQTDPVWPDEVPGVPVVWVALGQVGRVLKFLAKHAASRVVMVGGIKRPSWDDMIRHLKLDVQGMKLLGKALLYPMGDDALLTLVMDHLTHHGYSVVGVHEVMPKLLWEKGCHTQIHPTPENQRDIAHGWSVLETLSPLDIGQGVVIQQGLVLAIEAIEGTDAMIARAGTLKRGGAGPVLVKRPKMQQDARVDLPTIGPTTIESLIEAGFAGLAFQADKTLVVEKSRCVALADKAGLFLLGR